MPFCTSGRSWAICGRMCKIPRRKSSSPTSSASALTSQRAWSISSSAEWCTGISRRVTVTCFSARGRQTRRRTGGRLGPRVMWSSRLASLAARATPSTPTPRRRTRPPSSGGCGLRGYVLIGCAVACLPVRLECLWRCLALFFARACNPSRDICRMAPETLEKNAYSFATDVWAFGVTAWEVLSYGARPYPGVGNNQKALGDFLRQGKRLRAPVGCPAEVQAVLESCWHKNGDSRPQISRVVRQLRQAMATVDGVEAGDGGEPIRLTEVRTVDEQAPSLSRQASLARTVPAHDAGPSTSVAPRTPRTSVSGASAAPVPPPAPAPFAMTAPRTPRSSISGPSGGDAPAPSAPYASAPRTPRGSISGHSGTEPPPPPAPYASAPRTPRGSISGPSGADAPAQPRTPRASISGPSGTEGPPPPPAPYASAPRTPRGSISGPSGGGAPHVTDSASTPHHRTSISGPPAPPAPYAQSGSRTPKTPGSQRESFA
eukprot:Opistho-1_new@25974